MRLAESSSPPLYHLYHAAWSAADLLYPPVCAGCAQPGTRWCPACQAAAIEIHSSVCPVCGQPQAGFSFCPNCSRSLPAFTALRSCLLFQGAVRQALHRLKYYRDLGVGEVLAGYMTAALRRLNWPVDGVVPVPLSAAHLRQRGYNQAAFLALPLALRSGLAYRPAMLRRSRPTTSQVRLSMAARQENVRGAFSADPRLAAGRVVLLVDDVATTGATMDACAAALLSAGASRVYGLTLAHAIRRPLEQAAG